MDIYLQILVGLLFFQYFLLASYENFLDYMNLQRYLSIIISVLTIFPIYFLCVKFVGEKSALVGATLFVVDPRIITNSILGITDASFIFLVATTLLFTLSKNNKLIYASFGLAALSAIVRYEGLLLIIPLSIVVFLKFKKDLKIIPKYLVAIFIFLIIIVPMGYIRVDT